MARFHVIRRGANALQNGLGRTLCRWLLVAACGSLGACGGVQRLPGLYPPKADSYNNCVPYARDVSGVALRGDAWTWWTAAAGRYPRGHRPQPGAVLVLARSSRLSRGHLAVVTKVIGPRDIVVTHANWGWDSASRGKVHTAMAVTDVTPSNDWTALRFWNYDAGVFGAVYPAYGFIYQPRHATR